MDYTHEVVKPVPRPGFLTKLNTKWHEPVVWFYGFIMVIHALEHVFQAFQIYVLRMPRPESLGLLGMFLPKLVENETLHFGFAVFTIAGLSFLRPGFQGRARLFWDIAIVFQIWHFIEHAILQGQYTFNYFFFGAPVQTSVLQLWVPRPELHLIYNTLVFIPMIVAYYYHFYPPRSEKQPKIHCTCSRRRESS